MVPPDRPSSVRDSLRQIGGIDSIMHWNFLLAIGFMTVAGLVPSSQAQRPTLPPTRPAAAPSTGQFNFTPKLGEVVSDGFGVTVVLFQDGDRRMQVNQPEGWNPAGKPAEMYFENPKFPAARITLRLSSIAAPPKFDNPWIEAAKPLVVASVPRDSKNAAVTSVTPAVLDIAGWTSLEIKVAYDQAGRRFVNSWFFLRLGDGRLIETVASAREDQFPAVRTAAIQMLAGWSLVVPAAPPRR